MHAGHSFVVDAEKPHTEIEIRNFSMHTHTHALSFRRISCEARLEPTAPAVQLPEKEQYRQLIDFDRSSAVRPNKKPRLFPHTQSAHQTTPI